MINTKPLYEKDGSKITIRRGSDGHYREVRLEKRGAKGRGFL